MPYNLGNMFRNMPFILLMIAIVIIIGGQFISLSIYQHLYAISLAIKSLIIFLLPIIIFGLLFRSSINLAHNATKIISLILICVCISSLLALLTSFVIGKWIYNFNLTIFLPDNSKELEAAWVFEFPKLFANDKAMFAGIILGILTANNNLGRWHKVCVAASIQLEKLIANLFNLFIYLIPLFVAGFIAKLQYDGIILTLLKDYTLIFIVIAFSQLIYILFMYLCINKFKLKKLWSSVNNMLPAAISGFSTMSSATSMPLTIVGAEKNATLKDLVRSVIPATVNIHLVGDCFTTPILAYAILKNYAVAQPLLADYLSFIFYFIIAKFSVAAIPGGGIIVMLPILEAYLHFNADMMSLITALYILFDPINTCVNVLGNGAFAKIIDNIVCYLSEDRCSKKI